MSDYVRGYSVTMRQDKRTGEYLAVISSAYKNRHGERYYMGVCESDGEWAQFSPGYVTRQTVNVSEFPQWLKRRFDDSHGYIMHLATRLYR